MPSAQRQAKIHTNQRQAAAQPPVVVTHLAAPTLLQARLTIGPVDDPYEREAERVAEQVMRMPAPGIQRAPAQIQRCSKCAGKPVEELCPSCKAKTRAERMLLQRAADGATPEVTPDVEGQIQALRGGGQPLDGEVRRFMEPRFGYDFGNVRVHTGPQAARAASSVSALAFTLGSDVVFGAGQYQPGSAAGNHLIAHELTHVIQQGGEEQRLRRSPKEDAAQAGSIAQQVTNALNTPDPVAGVGDYRTAYMLLNGQSMSVMLLVLNELAANYMLEVLLSGSGQAGGIDLPRILAAAQLVRFAHTNASAIKQDDLEKFATNAQSLPNDQLREMLNFISTARRISAATREGLIAMMAGEMSSAGTGGLTPTMAAGVTGPVNPGAWRPPGNQPIPFYIGNEAHIGIAARYIAAHPGDPVFTNFVPLSSILQQASAFGLRPKAGVLTAAQLSLKPDILNLAPSRRHLYEIKPAGLRGVGRNEARMYVGLLTAAGIPVALGPSAEAGTAGVIPAPGGIYLFEAPEPGVIVYQYRRQRLVPVPKPEREKAPNYRFRLQPLTQQQQAVMVGTAVTGFLLILMMIALAPVGV